MAQLNEIFARFGIKVDQTGFKEAVKQLKAIKDGYRAIEAEKKASTVSSKAQEAALKVETQSLRNLEIQQRMEIRASKEADRQRGISAQGLRNFLIGITAVSYSIAKLTSATRNQVMAYRDFAFQTGMPLSKLQSLEAAAARVAPNLTGQRIASELTTLQQNLTNIEFGQGNIFPYQLLGISATTKDATKIVEGLRNAISGLSNARAINLIERMGLSRDWLYILRMSREEFEKINAVMLSDKQIKVTTQMSLALNQLKFSLGNLRNQLVAMKSDDLRDLFNNISGIADSLSRWFKETPNAEKFFNALTLGMTAFLLRAKPMMLTLGTILALIEDYWVATQGGRSLFGWGTGNPNANTQVKEIPEEERKTLKDHWNSFKKNILKFKAKEKTADQMISERMLDSLTGGFNRQQNQSIINNNITMNGYSPQAGGEFVGSVNQKQIQTSDLNMTSSQITTLGSA